MLTSNGRITLASVILLAGIASTAHSAEGEFVSGRVAQEIRANFSGKRLNATRTVTLEKAGEKITGQVRIEVTSDGKIRSIAVSTNLVAVGVDPDELYRRRQSQEYLDCATKNGCAGENSNARIAACYAACAAAIIVPDGK